MSFDTLIARLDPRPDRRGREFERICAWYLQNAPEYRAQVKRVWLWDEWPDRWAADAGIDVVVETVAGDLWAVQAKAYDPAYAIKKADVDSFLSESSRPQFAYRLLIATTDRVGHTARRTLAGQEKPAGLLLRSQLSLAEVEWPRSPADLRPRSPKRKRPRPHQRRAVNAVVNGFGTADRGQLVMACGTGKTLAACFLAQRLNARRVLVLVPSLSLLAQTLREWSTSAEFTYLAVCSDETVAGADAVVASTSELAIPVTTDPAAITSFLRRRGQDMRVVLATYQSSPRIAESQKTRTPAFDLVIADEAHRCAGPEAGVFATALDAQKIKASKRLFMTATPRYYTGRVRKEAQEADWEVASMDDESRFGPVLHRLSFADAIQKGLLSDYQVAVVGVSDATYRDYAERGVFVTTDGATITDARTLASQLGLLRAMAKYDLVRVVTFHSRIRSASDFARSLPEVCAWLPTDRRPKGRLWAEHVSGEMSSGERDSRLNRLRGVDLGERGVLTNARCLAEGVDVPTLDGVAFIEPRRSQVDVVQAVGRAMRKAEDKTLGTVVIPVFVDEATDPELALESGEFDRVWQILKALRAHDEALAEELDELRRELGRRGTLGQRPSKIVLDLPTGVGVEFARSFDARVVERSTSQWEEGVGAAHEFRAKHGHLRVLAKFVNDNGFKLGSWMTVRRQEWSQGKLSADRIATLDKLGMVWDPLEEDWQRGITAARSFRETHGHLRVPQRFVTADGFKLGAWISNRRFVRDSLPPGRVADLDALGMVWDPFEQDWQRGIAAVQEYLEANGDIRVPSSFVMPDGFKLGSWMTVRRQEWSQGKLSADRIATLDKLGMVWDPLKEDWQRGITAARSFRETHGHLRVPARLVTPDGFKLGAWISIRRLNRDRLSASRISQLDALGMVWDPFGEDWRGALAAAKSFRESHGHLLIHPRFKTDDGLHLGAWIVHQRSRHAKGSLSAEQIAALDKLGMVWDPNAARLETNLAAARRFCAAHGHLRVPSNYVDEEGVKLGAWLLSLRTRNRKGLVSSEVQKHLHTLGMEWNPAQAMWDRKLAAARHYREMYGHLRVPHTCVTDDGIKLGVWIGSLRPKRMRLSAVKRAQLDEVGMVWDPSEAGWLSGLSAAQNYYEAHGNLDVPNGFVSPDGFRLGAWLAEQRSSRRRKKLLPERCAELDKLHIDWEPLASKAERGLASARRFCAAHGHLRVPSNYVDDESFALGSWLSRVRQRRKQGSLRPTVMRELDEMGLAWDVLDEEWQRAIDAARAYSAEQGDLRVPARYKTPDGFPLGQWISIRRLNRDRLSASRISQLDALGMVWDPFGEDWETGVSAARHFHDEHGHLRVRASYVTEDGFKLGEWVAARRYAGNKGRLAKSRVKQLDALGMVWYPREEDWERGLAAARAFNASRGHLNVPSSLVTDEGIRLRAWLRARAKEALQGKLAASRRAALNALDPQWFLYGERRRTAPGGRRRGSLTN